MRVVSQTIRCYYCSNFSLASLLINLTDIVVASQFVEFQGVVHHCTSAIATGLSCGVFLANIYLSDMDSSISVLHNVIWYHKLVDDFCALTSDGHSADLLSTANGYHNAVTWKRTGSGNSVDFLDVTLSFGVSTDNFNHKVPRWRTYKKPLNSYLYVPGNSCHPDSQVNSLLGSS